MLGAWAAAGPRAGPAAGALCLVLLQLLRAVFPPQAELAPRLSALLGLLITQTLTKIPTTGRGGRERKIIS